MKKFFLRAGSNFYPLLITLLFSYGVFAQNSSVARSLDHHTDVESAVQPERSLETSAPEITLLAVNTGVGVNATRVSPTSQKGEVPVHGGVEFSSIDTDEAARKESGEDLPTTIQTRFVIDTGEKIEPSRFTFPKPDERSIRPRFFKLPENEDISIDDDDANGHPIDKFHWKSAILQSLMIQGVQHSYALVIQEKTRRALKGPFFQDYIDSIKGVRGWSDGNKFFTNYIAHPMQGAMTGFIFLQNNDRMKRQKFGESKQYWKDRFKAFVWSTAWSTNWELGPISQSSIGNVGLYDHQGYVDLVMTPTAGTGWMVVEEAFDRYIIRHIEKQNFTVKVFSRMLLNPMRSVANVLRFKKPWYRDRVFGD